MPEAFTDRTGASRLRRSRLPCRGDVLIESLISIALTGIICMGVAYLMARTRAMNAQTNAQAQAVSQMRAMLQQQGTSLCSNSPPSLVVGSTSVTVTVACSALSKSPISVSGTTVSNMGTSAEKKLSLSADSALFGGRVVVGD